MTDTEAQMASAEEESTMEATNGDGTDGSNGNAGGDAEERKLFCGGLSLDTTEADLRAHFEKFGEIEQCTVKMNPVTNKSRCFGFVTFGSKQALEDAMAAAPHTVKDKQIDPKPAKMRPGANKVFCGGLPPETTEEEIRAHFGQFGAIEALELPMDKEKNVRRGFIFVTYETVSAADAAAKQPKQTINGKECDVKKATPRNSQSGAGFRGGWGGGFGGRGGMRGGRGGAGGRGGYGSGGRTGGYGGQQGWGGYGGGYGGYDAASYGGGYGSYDSYGSGGWGAQASGYGGASQWQQGGSYGKQQPRGQGRQAGFHPYR